MDDEYAYVIMLELKMRAQNKELTTYPPLLQGQRRACLALKQMLVDQHALTDPEPERVHCWLCENELGFYFRVEYRFRSVPKIYAGITGQSHQVTVCLDYQLTLDDLRNPDGTVG